MEGERATTLAPQDEPSQASEMPLALYLALWVPVFAVVVWFMVRWFSGRWITEPAMPVLPSPPGPPGPREPLPDDFEPPDDDDGLDGDGRPG